MPAENPYISLVVAARHDDHGGGFMRRLQIFIDAFAAQCSRHRLRGEIVLVEWNPDPSRAPLREALQFPGDLTWCTIRIIEVPASVHNRFAPGKALPLFQMLAKNAGIRRALGEFVLATNVDLIFNDELMRFFAGGQLQKGVMYRIDRHDAAADVPAGVSITEQIEYCRNHLLRVNRREGTFPLTPTGKMDYGPRDIAAAGFGVTCGDGWFAPEDMRREPCRWAGDRAKLVFEGPAPADTALQLDIEPGPGVSHQPFRLRATDASGGIVAEQVVRRREIFTIPGAACGTGGVLTLETESGGWRMPSDPRVLNFRAFQIRWKNEQPLLPAWQRIFRWYFPNAVRSARSVLSRAAGLATPEVPEAPSAAERGQAAESPAFLHVNACGDFTLLHRDHWFELRAYPEFDCFSMNIDFLFCQVAHSAGFREQVLAEPMRVYHIEHGGASGWTPEGEAALYQRIRQKGIPWLHASQVFKWGRQMREFGVPLIFNLDSWGFRDEAFRETVFSGRRDRAPVVSAGDEL